MGWREAVSVFVEVGLRGEAAGEMVWDVSDWDDPSSTWSAVEPAWVALDDCIVQKLDVRRGRNDGKSRSQAGVAEVTVWYRAPEGRWTFRPTTPILLGSELRIRAVVAGSSAETIPIYRGTVRAIRDLWDAKLGTFGIRANLTDRFADLASVDPLEGSIVGTGELTHARVARTLDAADIPLAFSILGVDADSSGTVTHQGTNLARNLLDEAMVAVESDAGTDLVVDREGRIAFRRRQWWAPPLVGDPNPRWNSDLLTWSNVDGSEPIICPVPPFDTGQDLDDLRNSVSRAKAGGTAYTTTDSDSIIRYGLRTDTRFDLTCQSDADVEDVADLRLAELHDRTQKLDRVVALVEDRWPVERIAALVDVELGDQHRIRWDDGGPSPLSGTYHVQGIHHAIDGDVWRVEANLWAYAGFGLEPEATSGWGAGSEWGGSTWQGPA